MVTWHDDVVTEVTWQGDREIGLTLQEDMWQRDVVGKQAWRGDVARLD